jgi:23S rRNA (cytosine1962-C5)-methyltransferase
MPQAENGDIVRVTNNSGDILGYGFFSPQSQITCRIFEFSKDDKKEFDEQYWHTKISNAYQVRKNLIDFSHTNLYRLIHAEGDFFPGLIVDVYNDVAVVQILIKATEKLHPAIVNILEKMGYRYIYTRTKQNTHRFEEVTLQSGWHKEVKAMPLIAKENGIEFKIDVETGQKTGFFIDQRDNRQLLANFSKNKKILNTFSYSGGFSLYAIKAGASLVHSVDSSKEAIDLCNDNVALNFQNAPHTGYVEDCFDFLSNPPEQYDIIVLDPPAFAKNAKAVPNATRGYKNLNLAAFKQIKSGGLVFTFSCSQHIDTVLFRKIVFGAAADSGRNIRIVKQLTQPSDHPVNIYHPEGEYLKGLVLYVE